MSVGLYDADFFTYSPVPFNLEIMKLASYYKTKKEIVVLMKAFNPERYSRVIVRKDYDDGIYPPQIFKNEKVETGGYSLSNGIYVPMKDEIEVQRPDTSIYEKHVGLFQRTKELENTFGTMIRACHARVSMDGSTIWRHFEKQLDLTSQTRTIILHDYDVQAIKGIHDLVLDLSENNKQSAFKRSIGFKFPIKVSNGQDLLFWMGLQKPYLLRAIECLGVLDDETLAYIVKEKKLPLFKYTIGARSQYTENDFIKNQLPIIFKQMIFCGMNNVRIHFNIEDDFLTDRRWLEIFKLFDLFQSRIKRTVKGFKNYDTFFNFCKQFLYKTESLNIRTKYHPNDIVELFEFVRNESYELFRLFYECREVSLVGGNFQNDWTRD